MTKQRVRKRLSKTIFESSMEQGALLDRLASLSKVEYEKERKAAAKELGLRVSALDDEIKCLREAAIQEEKEKDQPFLQSVEPWPDQVDGEELIEELIEKINRYCKLPEYADIAIALWILHAHAHDAATISPILNISSPAMRSGKTTTLGVIKRLTPRALRVDNLTIATVFRVIDKWHPTLLIDEADTFMERNPELRGVLDSGHTRDGAVLRAVGDEHEPRVFHTWAPKVIVLIGRLPPTLEDRSITIVMLRKLSEDKVRRLRADRNPLSDLHRRIVRWVDDNMEDLRKAQPRTLRSLNDRAKDNWRPLFAIAEQLGIKWKKRAHDAARHIEDKVVDETPDILLLGDIYRWFERDLERDQFVSTNMCEILAQRVDRPWAEYSRGKPLTPHAMAKLLKPFGIESDRVYDGGRKLRGYHRKDFKDTFKRYLSHLKTRRGKRSKRSSGP